MSNEIIALHTAGLVVIKEGKLLLAFSSNKNAWYLPGGKIDSGENKNILMERDCFIYDLTKKIEASNEIDEVGYLDLETYLKEPAQVSGVLI